MKMDDFNATHTAVIQDLSDKGNNGTLYTGEGDISKSGNGLFGNALILDGNNDYIIFRDILDFNISTSITLEAWVYPTVSTLTYSRPILGKYYTVGNRAYQLNVDEGYSTFLGQGTFQFWVSSDGSTRDHVEAIGIPYTWQQVVGIYNGSELFLYVNGELKDSKTTTIPYIYLTPIPLKVGSNQNANRFFNGLIEEVAIWNRALSESEIQELYQKRLS